MMRYRLGLDIGIASVGYSIIRHDKNDQPCAIEAIGVNTFKPAEEPKTGYSLTVARREARGRRRQNGRKRYRLDKIKAFLQDSLLEGKSIDFSPCDIYQLRYESLDKLISEQALARVIYSMFKHRGFKSNRKSELKNKDNSKMLPKLMENIKKAENYRTIGEMYIKGGYVETHTKNVGDKEISYKVYKIRNKQGEYTNTMLRDNVLQEIDLILRQQKLFGNKYITDDFIQKIKALFSYQKSYDEGPDLPSPYHVSFKVGDCTFYPNEKRCPKAAFTYEYFTALCDINHLRIEDNNSLRSLTEKERKAIISKFLSQKQLEYKTVRQILKLEENQHFKGKSNCNDESKVFIKRLFSYPVCKILNFKNPLEHEAVLNEIAYIISMYKSDEKRMNEFKKNPLTNDLTNEKLEKLCELDFNKFGNLSIKAMKQIIPYLEKGDIYSDACEHAGLKMSKNEKGKKLVYAKIDELQDITSPVAKRAVSQTIKLVNSIIDKYGSPCAIFLELGREMSKNFAERKRIEKQQKENQIANEKYYNYLKEFIPFPSSTDVLKLKLYNEQNGQCMYSGKSFLNIFGDMKSILSNNNTQIDHIIPYSKCFDDSFNNKVLVLASENQNKGNRLPYEYIGENKERWESFLARVEATYTTVNKKENRKKNNLLKQKLPQQTQDELNNRALNDTRYISKALKDIFERYLIFEDSSLRKKPVRAVNGSMTAFMRKIWGIKKSRFTDDKHHALDAAVVACIDNGMIMRVSKFMQTTYALKKDDETIYYDKATGEIIDLTEFVSKYGKNYQYPFETFKKELMYLAYGTDESHREELKRLGWAEDELRNAKPLYIHRVVNHKVTGPIHEETVRSKKLFNEDGGKLIALTKTPLKNLKLDKNGEIAGYPLSLRNSDKRLYKDLRARLIEFNGDGKKAFEEPFYKFAHDEKNRNVVRSVKLQSIVSEPIEINNGVTENSSMIRVDIFEKKGKLYIIPVYIKDFYNRQLPNKICTSNPYPKWPELNETYTFKFSLFPNDVVRLKRSKSIPAYPSDKTAEKIFVDLNDEVLNYIGTDRSTGTLAFKSNDGKYFCRGVGIQSASIEKYQIDILGNLTKAPAEKRKAFDKCKK